MKANKCNKQYYNKQYYIGYYLGYKECCIEDFIKTKTHEDRQIEQRLVSEWSRYLKWCPLLCQDCAKKVISGEYKMKSDILDLKRRNNSLNIDPLSDVSGFDVSEIISEHVKKHVQKEEEEEEFIFNIDDAKKRLKQNCEMRIEKSKMTIEKTEKILNHDLLSLK